MNLLVDAADRLSQGCEQLAFKAPVTHVYNPLQYAWEPHKDYLERYGNTPKRVLFVGMNPGPFGMTQTGIPFGEVNMVRDWLNISGRIILPRLVNPARLIEGFDCSRSEVSGKRLWGLFKERFGTSGRFFAEHFVVNYCPLAFFAEAKNLTPDKLAVSETAILFALCDAHLRQVIVYLQPEWVIGVGGFATQRVRLALPDSQKNRETSERVWRVGQILHPSPANPHANRGWAEAAAKQLEALGVWGSAI